MSENHEPGAPILSPLQRRMTGWAITCLALATLGAFAIGSVTLLGRFMNRFGDVLWPLIVAGVLSLLLDPVCDFIERRLRLSRVAAIVLLYLLVAGTVALIALILLPALWEQLSQLLDHLPVIWDRMVNSIGTRFPQAAAWLQNGGLREWIRGHSEELLKAAGEGAPALAQATVQLKQFAAKVAGLAIIPVYLFYLLDLRRDFVADLEREARFLPKTLHEDLVFLVRQFVGILVAFFRGQILIGLILGVLLATGFSLCGVSYGLLLGLMMGLGNIIPYLGTMLGLATVLPVAYLQEGGGAGMLGAALGVILFVQALEGYLITPKIMGSTTGLHPMAIVLSVFFWGTALDGILGMVIAVPLTAFFVVFWRLMKERHLVKPAPTAEPAPTAS